MSVYFDPIFFSTVPVFDLVPKLLLQKAVKRFIAFGDSLESNYVVGQCAAGEALRGSCIVKQGCQLFNP